MGRYRIRHWGDQQSGGGRAHARLRGLQATIIGGSAIFAGLVANGTVAFAHHITGTTPSPSTGAIGTTPLADIAHVVASNDRDVVFFLWAPNTCGSQGAQPVFTDTQEVVTKVPGAIEAVDVTSASYKALQLGTYAWTAEIVVDSSGAVENVENDCTKEPVTVTKAQPQITTKQSDGGPVGTAIWDTAFVTGGFNPSGQVSFKLFGPDNPDCKGDANNPQWLERWQVDLVNGKASTKSDSEDPTFTTQTPGVYHWEAEFIADTNNMSADSGCKAEPVTITKADPSITTTTQDSTGASNSGTVGQVISDNAALSGGFNPTGTVTFKLYAPSDSSCDGTAVYTSPAEEISNGKAKSGTYTTTTVGTYHWIATYSGDSNNNPISTTCASESYASGKAGVSIATTASAGGVIGTAIHDTASVSGGDHPSGTVTFTLYAPSDTSCSATPIYTSTVSLNSGAATSGTFSNTSSAGTYRWIASYSGDSNNGSAASQCGAETVVITPASQVQGITTPGTGADVSLRLVLGLLILGGGLVSAGAAGLISRRRNARNS